MKRIVLALAFVAALAAGGLSMTNTAEARHGCYHGGRGWYGGGGYYGGRGYYSGYRGYYPRAYYSRSYYGGYYPGAFYGGYPAYYGGYYPGYYPGGGYISIGF